MFDTHIHKSGDNITKRVTEKVTLNEHRAPTDESIKLLKEFKEKATQNIVDEIIIENNFINGCILVFVQELHLMGIGVTVHIKFNLNGNTFTSKKDFKRSEFFDIKGDRYNRNEKLFRYFYDEVSKHISMNLFKENEEEIKKYIVSN